jgi:uncharacterized damage-inducible protein DinB
VPFVAAGLTQGLSDGINTYLNGNGRIAQYTGTGSEYFLTDGLGSVRQLVDYPSVKYLQEAWIQKQHRMELYLRGLEDDDLVITITYKRIGGEERSNILWHLVMHVVLHGADHRSEAGSILTSFGRSPGDIDFIHFLRARRIA